jgi:hypothetical protein
MTTRALSGTTQAAHVSEKLWLVLAIILVGGISSGVLFCAITYNYQFIFFSAMIPALAAFGTISYAVWKGSIRSRPYSLALGLLLAVLIYGVFQGARYVTFRRQVVESYMAQYGATAGEAEQMMDEDLLAQTGAGGFLGFIGWQLQRGMVISSVYRVTGPANEVTGSAYLVYWLYDAVLIFGGALSGAWWANSRTYCEHCRKYYGRIKTSGSDMGMDRLGWVEKQSTEEFARLLDAGHFEQAGTLLRGKRSRQVGLDIQIERCDSCDTKPVLLSIYGRRSFWTSQPRLFLRREISPDDYSRLTAFATFTIRKRRISTTDEWALSLSLAVLFISGLFLLAGLAQSHF